MISKLFKFSKLVLGVAIVAAPFAVKAQTYGTISVANVPTAWLAATATNVGTVIDCRYNRNIGIYAQAQGTNTSTSAITAVFNQSADGLNFDTLTPRVVTWALNNTTVASTTTNWDIGAIGYLKLAYITNAAGTGISNVVVQVALKPGQ